MLVKIQDVPVDLVDRLKASTGMVTASKAFLAVAQQHHGLKLQIAEQETQIASLRERLEHANSVIASAQSAAASLLGNVQPGRKHVSSLKDLADGFESQTALDLDEKKFAERDMPGMPYV